VAVSLRDRLKLSTALHTADNLDMGSLSLTVVAAARDMLRDLETKHRAARAASALPEVFIRICLIFI
jgi:hypothetical protein